MLAGFQALLLFLYILSFLGASSCALPTARAHIPRAGGLEAPLTIVSNYTTQTNIGPMRESCDILLTPILLSNGTQAVEVVKKCTLFPIVTADVGPDPTATTISTITSALATAAAATDTPPPSPSPITLATDTPTPSPSPPPTTDTPTPPPALPAQTQPPPEPDPGSTTPGNPAAAVQTSTTNTSSAPDGTSSPFSVGGKKLSVLPIGLGVFAGISVIALIIVGLVTYERTKYRKAFRQRKRAEAAQQAFLGRTPFGVV